MSHGHPTHQTHALHRNTRFTNIWPIFLWNGPYRLLSIPANSGRRISTKGSLQPS